ncbi:hypothetical protein QCA50_001182, partial [Cerrena zonata]
MIDPTDNMKAFYQVGDLIGMLIAGDLAYADIINKPTVEEMGKLVAKVSKGAVGGLVYLQLVEQKSRNAKYSVDEVQPVFVNLYQRLKEDLGEEWEEMKMDPIVFEHSL